MVERVKERARRDLPKVCSQLSVTLFDALQNLNQREIGLLIFTNCSHVYVAWYDKTIL